MNNPVFCALDTSDFDRAQTLITQLTGRVGGFKLGLEFFSARGPAGVRALAIRQPLFLDLKLHDIPSTVAAAIRALAPLNPAFLTVHASGGQAMLQAAQQAVAEAGMTTKLLTVTLLSSLEEDDLPPLGVAGSVADQVQRLATLAMECGLAGVVCAPQEVAQLRRSLGREAVLMVPGVRPVGSPAHDQKRPLMPREAIAAGADYLVIGRPITAAPDPAAAAQRILDDLSVACPA